MDQNPILWVKPRIRHHQIRQKYHDIKSDILHIKYTEEEKLSKGDLTHLMLNDCGSLSSFYGASDTNLDQTPQN